MYKLGRTIDKNERGEIRKATIRGGVHYFVWATGATVANRHDSLAAARGELGIEPAHVMRAIKQFVAAA